MRKIGRLFLCTGIAAWIMACTSCQRQLEPVAEAFALETENYTLELVEQYSDTHYTELFFQIARKDGEPMEQGSAGGIVQAELQEPDWHTFSEVASRPVSTWDENGNLTYSYQIYTSPLHEEVSLHFTAIGEDTCDLTCALEPEKGAVKTASPDDTVQQLLVSQRSLYLSFSGERGPVSLSVEGEDGTVYYSEEDISYNPSGKVEDGQQLYAVHCFFRENPLPLEEVSRIRVNDSEIPVE